MMPEALTGNGDGRSLSTCAGTLARAIGTDGDERDGAIA